MLISALPFATRQEDPAYAVISKLIAQLNGRAKAAHILISQAATSTSQKICNLQAGIRVCSKLAHQMM